MLERAFRNALFCCGDGGDQSLMERPISNGGDASRVGENEAFAW